MHIFMTVPIAPRPYCPNHEAEALAAGADAFLVKECASKKLFEAILNRLKEDQ